MYICCREGGAHVHLYIGESAGGCDEETVGPLPPPAGFIIGKGGLSSFQVLQQSTILFYRFVEKIETRLTYKRLNLQNSWLRKNYFSRSQIFTASAAQQCAHSSCY